MYSKEAVEFRVMIPNVVDRKEEDRLQLNLFEIWPEMVIKKSELEVMSKEGTSFFDQWELSCPLGAFESILQRITEWGAEIVDEGLIECILLEQRYIKKYFIR